VQRNSSTGLQTAIRRYTGGFPLPAGDANGQCSPSSLAPISFGFNATSTCYIPLTLQQLRDLCVVNSKSSAALLEKILGDFAVQMGRQNVYVGIWGNSNWTSYADWTQVMPKDSFPNLIWQNGTGQCQNVIVGYDIQILTGLAFAANNAQQMALYVNVCYRTATWTFPAYADPTVARRFFMTSTVNFIPLYQTPVNVYQPAPPLSTPLPEEIFYPFVTSSANRVVISLGFVGLAVSAALSIVCLI
jgi:tectonic-1/3